MRTSVANDVVQLTPEVTTTLDIDVVNTSPVISGYSALVRGLDPAWVQLVQPVITLFPEGSGRLTLRFDIPPSCPAGESAITVRVFSTVDQSDAVDHVLWIDVAAVEAADIELRPSLITGGSSASTRAIVHNTGNSPSEFAVAALEPTRAVECTVTPTTQMVEPGSSAEFVVTARGRRPWFGQSAERSLQVTAVSPTLQLSGAARFVQKPRIARGVLTSTILALIIALWAVIFLFVIKFLRAGVAPAKSVPATWIAGAREIKLADVAASISGAVTAATNGEPLPRITVEAYRSDPNGKPVLVGSGATGDDGTYALSALLPGKYRLRFSAAGYTPVWYPKATSAEAAELLAIDPVAVLTGKNIVLAGETGTISGQIAAPPGSGGAGSAAVTVTLLPDTPDQQVPPPQKVSATGTFSVSGLPTPARYEVRIERPGFDPQVIVTKLGGGQGAVLDTANLLAANGSISGTVVDGSGTALGGATVTIRSGSLERVITTPTVGSVGAFTIGSLPTPGTYVLTFALEGYTSATVALELGGGESRTGVSATLIGGAGSIQGTVRNTNGAPIGGATVTVLGPRQQFQTATLTSGVGINGIGTYSLAGLPVPGNYTITISKPGYQSTTLGVTFTGAGLQSGLNAVLAPAASTVSGTVSVGATPTSGIRVSLSDGATPRTVVTAAAPGGAFSFANVTPGWYTLTFSSSTVQTQVLLIEVVQGADLVRTVSLTAGP